MDSADHVSHMRRALVLAQRGRGGVEPNPLVGAVIVRDGVVVGEGWHAEFGGPHAEVLALRAAGDAAAGATLYVTLEPCAHVGKTPPCTDAIIGAGVAHVIFAAGDPNRLAGGGADVLRAAGIRVTAGIGHGDARTQNAAFFYGHEHDAPWFTLKLAVSIDGRIAAAPGQRTQLTGSAARVETHRLRAAHDAVLIGIGTALIDDPSLTVREVPARRQPARVVLDSRARLPVRSRLVQTVDQAPVIVVCSSDAPDSSLADLRDAGVLIMQVEASRQGVRPDAVAAALWDAGLRTVFVEGGSRIASALLEAELIRRLHLFIAPLWLGTAAVPAFALEMPIRSGWSHTSSTRFDCDVLLTLDRAEAA